ncbi:nicotinate-nucleotide--dimethylbenzimidazole phosphoribosyltransferase [Paludibacterium denitrificans]|uniref:nicotinate-nucleotide--dimethylbenzimidazole phosphoribosyltransferase n=1 Tax=Paludibacterium denitrificans TaxID=2675226 RepID=UPI001E2F0769|nr:nicotinate-nucleotide--dimethylbenzimidazole phosphoribosyltransferase [Paludibacterium denitrificans]
MSDTHLITPPDSQALSAARQRQSCLTKPAKQPWDNWKTSPAALPPGKARPARPR